MDVEFWKALFESGQPGWVVVTITALVVAGSVAKKWLVAREKYRYKMGKFLTENSLKIEEMRQKRLSRQKRLRRKKGG